MADRVLIEKHGDIGGNRLPAEALEGGEAHQDGGHLIFIHKDDFFGKFPVVAGPPVTPEKIVQQLCHVLNHQVLFCVADAEILAPEALGVPVHHHGNCQIVCHPAVTEHGLDVSGFYNEFAQDQHDAQPAGVIIERIL